MSNTQRPTAARKQTLSTKAKRDEELNVGVQITFDGETYTVREGDMTSRLERELRREYGGSFDRLKYELGTDAGLDSIAALIWLARRIAGEEIAFDDVELSYADFMEGVEVEVVGKPSEDHLPEA